MKNLMQVYKFENGCATDLQTLEEFKVYVKGRNGRGRVTLNGFIQYPRFKVLTVILKDRLCRLEVRECEDNKWLIEYWLLDDLTDEILDIFIYSLNIFRGEVSDV